MDQGTTLPRERLHVVYKDANDGKEIELPLRLLFVGAYMGRDERPIEQRVPIRIDRDSFPAVLAAHAPRLDVAVASADPAAASGAVRASLSFRKLSDFSPDGIAQQIPEVNRLLAVRDALTELKNTGDIATFRARVETLLDGPARTRLLVALGLGGP